MTILAFCFRVYSQVQGEHLIAAGISLLWSVSCQNCMHVDRSVLYFAVTTPNDIFSNHLPPINVACTFVFSVSVNIPEQGSSLSDKSRLDSVVELEPREAKLSS